MSVPAGDGKNLKIYDGKRRFHKNNWRSGDEF